ncbi:MAG: decarboxylating 6-phosphogluconate dehydrogenase, partial [Gemmatimonadetes bacterium]|nr:decarboxylating 6-phosphogluconate dehydrogenase [Gemmatimonadota bacterium]
MQLGMIGLGRMGGNMLVRLARRGHDVVGFDPGPAQREQAEAQGGRSAADLERLVAMLQAPRVIWMMVPQGDPVDQTIAGLLPHLQAGDILVDGGNSRYTQAPVRAAALEPHGVAFVDAGTSGGIWGLEEGYCLMIGGPREAVERLTPVFRDLAPENGFAHVGASGAGHFVKMVHNAVEYGMLQAYGEGFEMLHSSPFDLDLAGVAELWRHGSVVRSWLLDLTARALTENPNLDGIAAIVPDSGEGRWTVVEAVELGCSLPVITIALQERFRSREKDP